MGPKKTKLMLYSTLDEVEVGVELGYYVFVVDNNSKQQNNGKHQVDQTTIPLICLVMDRSCSNIKIE